MAGNNVTHPYHLVNPSHLPVMGSLSALLLAVGGLLFMHDKPHGDLALIAGFAMVLFTFFSWWRTVIKEAIVEQKHNTTVRIGLRLGMALFILSEVMFFFAFFFAFFRAAIFPPDLLGDAIWPEGAGTWPPAGIETFNPWTIPFLNTLILLLSGTAVTWAHHALLHGDRKGLVHGLFWTVFLGAIFTGWQAFEYTHAAFGYTDGVYAANFYMATGFHGFHVLVGTIFLLVCLLRAMRGHFTQENHLGLEFAAWYWHFVDVVWLFLFVFVYIWGA